MDALEVLRRDHERIRRLLQEWRDVQADAQRGHDRMLRALADELELHERREKEVLYPVLNTQDETRPLALEGYQQHQLTDWIMEDLRASEPVDPGWQARFNLIEDVLQMHVEEQERPILECARPVLGDERLEELGERMAAIRRPER